MREKADFVYRASSGSLVEVGLLLIFGKKVLTLQDGNGGVCNVFSNIRAFYNWQSQKRRSKQTSSMISLTKTYAL